MHKATISRSGGQFIHKATVPRSAPQSSPRTERPGVATIRMMPHFIDRPILDGRRGYAILNETTNGENFADNWNKDERPRHHSHLGRHEELDGSSDKEDAAQHPVRQEEDSNVAARGHEDVVKMLLSRGFPVDSPWRGFCPARPLASKTWHS